MVCSMTVNRSHSDAHHMLLELLERRCGRVEAGERTGGRFCDPKWVC